MWLNMQTKSFGKYEEVDFLQPKDLFNLEFIILLKLLQIKVVVLNQLILYVLGFKALNGQDLYRMKMKVLVAEPQREDRKRPKFDQ